MHFNYFTWLIFHFNSCLHAFTHILLTIYFLHTLRLITDFSISYISLYIYVCIYMYLKLNNIKEWLESKLIIITINYPNNPLYIIQIIQLFKLKKFGS